AHPSRLSSDLAMEFAHVFAAFGTEVTVLARGPRLLGDIDEEAADEFTRIFESTHTVLRGAVANRLELADDEVRLTLEPSGRLAEVELPETITADAVLIATGRVPNTAELGVAAAGFAGADDQGLSGDEHQRVLADGEPVPGVFALGDICSPHQLKHVANHA